MYLAHYSESTLPPLPPFPNPFWLLQPQLTDDVSAPQVPEGNVVMLSFRIFDLEADSQCRYDYLDVYNGLSSSAQKLGRFCGTFRPGSLISTSNTMMLEMVTDAETQSRGFVAFFSGAKPYVNGRWSQYPSLMNFIIRTEKRFLFGRFRHLWSTL